jgi:prephenate dehydrogenase
MTAAPADTRTGKPATPIPVLAVVGVGLIGGSFAAALRRAGHVGQVLGVGRNGPSLARARELGLIDDAVTAAEAAARADLILLAAPVGTFGAILAEMRAALKPGAIITDAGSTKADVVQAARRVLAGRSGAFVPGHPIAGAERIGPDAADPDLYTGRNVILTPLPENAAADVERVRAAWQACGARVLDMDAAEHDRVLASVSHIPHFLAAVYVAQVARSADSQQRLAVAGTGFRDFTRIAAGSAEMWRDIFLSNRPAMKAELAEVRAVLDEAERALDGGDGAGLQALLEEAARFRRAWKPGH